MCGRAAGRLRPGQGLQQAEGCLQAFTVFSFFMKPSGILSLNQNLRDEKSVYPKLKANCQLALPVLYLFSVSDAGPIKVW